MNEMDGRRQGLNSHSDWLVRSDTFATNGKYIPGAIGSVHSTSGVASGDSAARKKERKEWWAEGAILGASAAGLIYGIVLIVTRCFGG